MSVASVVFVEPDEWLDGPVRALRDDLQGPTRRYLFGQESIEHQALSKSVRTGYANRGGRHDCRRLCGERGYLGHQSRVVAASHAAVNPALNQLDLFLHQALIVPELPEALHGA